MLDIGCTLGPSVSLLIDGSTVAVESAEDVPQRNVKVHKNRVLLLLLWWTSCFQVS